MIGATVCRCGHSDVWHALHESGHRVWCGERGCDCETYRPVGLPDDLMALATRLAADPKDALTVQALADWVEERAGDCRPLRTLWADDGDLIVFGHPGQLTEAARRATERHLEERVAGWFRERGRDVRFVVMPADWTIRQVKAGAAREAAPLPASPGRPGPSFATVRLPEG